MSDELRQDTPLLLSVFALGETLFALDALLIQEITLAGRITPVRRAPADVLGIINLRGRIVTVIDPALRMGLAAFEPGRSNRILIADCGDEPIGLIVSRVVDVLPVERDQLLPPPSNLRQLLGGFLGQVFRHQEHVVSILDLTALMTVEDRA